MRFYPNVLIMLGLPIITPAEDEGHKKRMMVSLMNPNTKETVLIFEICGCNLPVFKKAAEKLIEDFDKWITEDKIPTYPEPKKDNEKNGGAYF